MTLPDGWAETTLNQVTTVRTVKADPSTLGSMHFVGLEHVEAQTGKLLGRGIASDVRSAVARFEAGDILYGRLRPYLNKVIEAAEFGCASAELIPLTPAEDVSSGLLRRILMSEQFLAFTAALDRGDRPRVSADEIGNYRIALPPAPEQRRIVAKLDALTTRLARARAELNRVPVLAQRLRQTFVDELAKVSERRSVRFDEVLDYKGGSQPPKSTFHAEPGHGRIRLLQIRDFASDAKAVYINDNGKWPRCRVDDVMIGRYGASVGKVLTGKAGAYNVALVKMIFDRSIISPRFLYHWLTGAEFQGRLSSISRSAQDGFNKGDLANLPFPLLPIIEQERVAAAVDDAFARADRLEAEAARARALINRLEVAILARAFRGELVPQDPADEPASVLLDRIRAGRAAAPKSKRGRRASLLAL